MEQRSLAGYSPEGCKELDTTEHIDIHSNQYHTYHAGNMKDMETNRLVSLETDPLVHRPNHKS